MSPRADGSLRVGLLLCDHVSPDLMAVSGDYEDMFRRLFSPYPEVDLIAYDSVNGEIPPSPSECDAWMTTGSRYSVNDDARWIRALEDLIRTIESDGRPFVGVCFGHQLLAKALGGRVALAETGWSVGVKEIQVRPGVEFVPSSVSSLRVFNSNQEQVVSTPDGADVIAWSEDCPVSMMTIADSLFGIQGHPEIDMDYGRALITSRRGTVVPQEVADLGLSTLAQGSDSEVTSDLILRFIAGH